MFFHVTNCGGSPPFVPTQARSGDRGQGDAMSVGPIWHACIAICPAKHRNYGGLAKIGKY